MGGQSDQQMEKMKKDLEVMNTIKRRKKANITFKVRSPRESLW